MAIASAGYEPRRNSQAAQDAAAYGTEVLITTEISQAVKAADVLYTDVWASMGQEAERMARIRVFKPYQINRRL